MSSMVHRDYHALRSGQDNPTRGLRRSDMQRQPFKDGKLNHRGVVVFKIENGEIIGSKNIISAASKVLLVVKGVFLPYLSY